jgi:hypothetical protein
MAEPTKKIRPEIRDEDKDAFLRVIAQFPKTQEAFLLEVYDLLPEIGQLEAQIQVMQLYREQLIEDQRKSR